MCSPKGWIDPKKMPYTNRSTQQPVICGMESPILSPALLHTLERGEGSLSLLFMHYFGGSAQEWQPLFSRLASQFHCLAVDMPGHGESPDTGFSVDDMADAVLQLIADRKLTRFVLIGHSMSGKVALALAARQPAGLEALLLVAPSPPRPEPIPDADRQQMLDTHGQQQAASDTAAKITALSITDGDREQIIQDNLRTSPAAWTAWLTRGSREDISDRMSGVEVPVHILAGTADRALAASVQPELTLPYLPGATFETLNGTGHLIPYEAPDALAQFIIKKIGV